MSDELPHHFSHDSDVTEETAREGVDSTLRYDQTVELNTFWSIQIEGMWFACIPTTLVVGPEEYDHRW